MSDNKELDDLIDLLLLKTKQGKLTWSLTGSDLITTRLSNTLAELRERAPNASYHFVIRNENGIVLSSVFLDGGPAKILFNDVKRLVLGVDKALKDMKEKLQSL